MYRNNMKQKIFTLSINLVTFHHATLCRDSLMFLLSLKIEMLFIISNHAGEQGNQTLHKLVQFMQFKFC